MCAFCKQEFIARKNNSVWEWLTLNEAALLLHVSPLTLRR
jgi:hypothetical protein